MGGLCFILGTVFAVCLALTSLLHGSPELMGGPDSRGLYLAIFSAFGFGLIGFLDDFIKVVKKRNLGLRAWQKIVGPAAGDHCAAGRAVDERYPEHQHHPALLRHGGFWNSVLPAVLYSDHRCGECGGT